MLSTGMPTSRWLVGFLFGALGVLSGCDPRTFFEEPAELVYVTASVLNLREGPTTKAKVQGRLSRGAELEVVRRADAWVHVRTEKSGVGWVHGDYVGTPAAVREALGRELRSRPARGRTYHPPPAQQRPARRPAQEDPNRLNLTLEEMMAGFPEELVVEELDEIEGERRAAGAMDGGRVVVEFWGDPENLSRAAMMVPVVEVPGEELAQHAGLARRFIRNAVPGWSRDAAWLADKLRELTRLDVGEGKIIAGSRAVVFEFIKPLGSVRIVVEPTGSEA